MFTKSLFCPAMAYLFIDLLALLSSFSISSTQATISSEGYGTFESCTAGMQEAALANLESWQCEPRDQVVDLEIPNATYSNMVPMHIMVKRCGGTCGASRYKSCLPTERRYRNVDVLLLPHNPAEDNECSTVSVEVHDSCTCGCKTTSDQCSEIQRFVPRECKCVCADTVAKRSCRDQGNYWDETSCSCVCLPTEQWPDRCPAGYAFNPSIETCACVSISEVASSVLEILIVVLVSSMALISVGLVQCYRTKTGLFREDPEASRRITETSSLRLTGIRRPPSEDHGSRSRHSTAGSPKFMTLNELRSLFRMLSRTSRGSNPSSPNSPTHRAPPSESRTFLSPNINYIPISEATSRSQSSTSVTTNADDTSNTADLLSATASPSGPSRIPTICEELNELDDEESSPHDDQIDNKRIQYFRM